MLGRLSAISRPHPAILTAAVLLSAHIGVIALLGTSSPGPLISDLIQLTLGGLVVFACIQASHRSLGLARSFWRLTAVAYGVWFLAQSLSLYTDLAVAPRSVDWTINLLFSFWFVPLALAMFLDPNNEAGTLDALTGLDFIQAVLLCMSAYVYFFYLPKAESPNELAHSVWMPYFVGYGFVAGAFLLRAGITDSQLVRTLFGRLGTLLTVSGCADALYYYGPGRYLRTGAWFDILWSILLIAPMLIAFTWRPAAVTERWAEAARPQKRIYTEDFHLLYPLLILIMSLRIARQHLTLAAIIVFLSFACSSARLLVTQHRLVTAKDLLYREASRDALTGLWNRKAILEILNREWLRSQREGESVGVIMADADHFKAINDSKGHAAGDLVLRLLASEIAAGVRPYDSVGRYGGEEFLIVAPRCGMLEIWELAERIRSYVASCSIVSGGSSVNVSLSLGVATSNADSDPEQLLQAADAALYEAKNAGRNRVAPSLGFAASAGSGSTTVAQHKFWL